MNSKITNNIKLITLIGMMGSGKTSCGSVLAKKLGISFIDIDNIIEIEEDQDHGRDDCMSRHIIITRHLKFTLIYAHNLKHIE